ncbi:hypothetical protein FOCC_FOCC005460 [Frankliniella occidentalis]|nr:hypothetical protein FOCC_FOCC005460 [Frankliniella occidentalis]
MLSGSNCRQALVWPHVASGSIDASFHPVFEKGSAQVLFGNSLYRKDLSPADSPACGADGRFPISTISRNTRGMPLPFEEVVLVAEALPPPLPELPETFDSVSRQYIHSGLTLVDNTSSMKSGGEHTCPSCQKRYSQRAADRSSERSNQPARMSQEHYEELRQKLSALPCWTWKTGDVELAPGTAIYINNVDLLLICRTHKSSKRKLFISLLRTLLTDDVLSSKGLSCSGKQGTVRVPEAILKSALAYATTVGEGDDFKTVTKIVSNLLQRFQSPRPSRPKSLSHHTHSTASVNAASAIRDAVEVDEEGIEAVYSVLPDATCWVCQQCGKDCKLKSALLRHVKQECPVEYRCDLCNQVFKKKSHYLKHAERSAHTCERCGKKFCWKETLKRHQKLECVHAYWCGGCHRAFPLESLLVAHAEHGCDAVRIKSPST